MEEEVKLTDVERFNIESNRSETFRVYHARTLATVLELLLEKKNKEAIEYIKSEIHSIKGIKRKEFEKLIDALTINLLILKGQKNDKNDRSV
jgi:alcohol dehydrogenase YqhD (iron-dependent ADH family)